MLWWHTSSYSHKLLAGVVLAYLAGMASQGFVTGVLALAPTALTSSWQVWRFFTYPFALQSTPSIIVGSFVLYNLAPDIEDILGKQRFGLTVFAFVILHGVMFLGIFSGRDMRLAGPDALALALLTIYTYIYPKSDVSILGMFSLRTWMMALIFGAIAILPPLFQSFGNPIAVIAIMSNQMFGVFAGLLFSQVYFEKYTLHKYTSSPGTPQTYTDDDTVPLSNKTIVGTPYTRTSEQGLSPVLKTSSAQSQNHSDDIYSDETILNAILDKIPDEIRCSS